MRNESSKIPRGDGKKREVVHVRGKISPRFEVSSIMKPFDGGPVLLFDKVKGHETKIAEIIDKMRKSP